MHGTVLGTGLLPRTYGRPYCLPLAPRICPYRVKETMASLDISKSQFSPPTGTALVCFSPPTITSYLCPKKARKLKHQILCKKWSVTKTLGEQWHATQRFWSTWRRTPNARKSALSRRFRGARKSRV